ncbi:MAG: hypothetical protein K0R59_239 [Sphingobacterium sp.]|jgi:hypothetical protein|nr:hypothetical protein [Sphingobacterium sp.]
MFIQVIDLLKNKKTTLNKLDIRLSIDSFVQHLREFVRVDEEGEQSEIFTLFLKKFDRVQESCGPLSVKNLSDYSVVLFYIYQMLSSPLQDEKHTLWALAAPLGKSVFYGTQGFYSFFHQEFFEDSFKNLGERTKKQDLTEEAMYQLILERFYDIPITARETIELSSKDKETGLLRYYTIDIDRQFVKILPKADLPKLEFGSARLDKTELLGLDFLRNILPLDHFTFEGFCIVTVRETTADRVLQNIRDIIYKNSDIELQHSYTILEESLQTLIGHNEVKLGLSSILQLNKRPILDQVYMHRSILCDLLTWNVPVDMQTKQLDAYLLHPRVIIYNVPVEFDADHIIFLESPTDLGIDAYICIPIYYNGVPTGLLEVYTQGGRDLNNSILTKLNAVVPLLAQLLSDQSNRFNSHIEAVIKERFTSLQPAVQWKFNEAAYHYLKKLVSEDLLPVIGNIQFKDVYPLYGAVDIRNSTVERNKAMVADYKIQLSLLKQLLQQIKIVYDIILLDEMIFNCDKWLMQLDIVSIDVIQMKIKEYLEKDIAMLLSYYTSKNTDLAKVIEQYSNEISEQMGKAHLHQRGLESAIARINAVVNDHLELFNDEIQCLYPCYFEKFRTDGIEYDIYIGQSIAIEQAFDHLYLKNARLKQLASMASIAKSTHHLLPEMDTPLETTQLIFVNGNVIDISFRIDEKRFDVEGAYNIRYQIIKKRIDKVHLKDSTERLTQPGKIALVYYDAKEIKEYIDYIQYLQSIDILLEDLEELELEELQGVSGLKAIRIGVRL